MTTEPTPPAPRPEGRRAKVGRRLLAGTVIALLPIMLGLSRDFGVTWDELPRQRFGERIFRYYAGEFGVERFGTDGSRFYGGLFDATAVALQRLLPFDDYDIRHALNAFYGWLGVAACAALATRLAGPWAGLLAALFAASAPRYFGHSMNNPKDIPFAALGAGVLYALSWIRPAYPYLDWRAAAAIGFAIGLSLSVRPGGVLFLAYAAAVVLMAIVANRERDPRRLAATAAAFVLLAFIATTVPLPFWPWLQTRPYVGLLEAVGGVSEVGWDGAMLFKGREITASTVPGDYIPVWLVYTTPPVVLAGALLSLGWLRRGVRGGFPVIALWFAVLFPMVYVVVRQSRIYDEIRHLLFAIPPLFVLASLGWWWLLGAARGAYRTGVLTVLVLGVLEPIAFQARNHPNQVVYFNALLGGPKGALQRFELDYWGNCLYEAMQHAAELARGVDMQIRISGERSALMALNASRIPDVRVTSASRGLHHLEVIHLRGPKAKIVSETHRTDILYRVTMADGTPLCTVVPGPRYEELDAQLRGARNVLPSGATAR
jgi:hypothetical protein